MKLLVLVAVLSMFGCASDKTPDYKTLNDYDSENRTGGVQFIGDSITEFWPIELMPAGSYNRGMSGDTTDDILSRLWLTEREQPEEIYLMIGINNLHFGWEPETVIDGLNEILIQLSISCPDTTIHVMGLFFSDKAYQPDVIWINEQIEILLVTHSNVVEFIPTFDLFPDGLNTYDGTHPSYAGYKLLLDRLVIF